MSNRDTDVYDNIIIDSSTSNKDICNNLNLPYVVIIMILVILTKNLLL